MLFKLVEFLQSLWSRFVKRILPTSMKRMVVISSLISGIDTKSSEEDKKTMMSLLNQEFNLANDKDAMLFAVELGKILWKDVKTRYQGTTDDLRILAYEIFQRCPESLRYADDKIMQEDIVNALIFMQKHAKPPV